MFTATLIAAQSLKAGDISSAADRLTSIGISGLSHNWVEPEKAADLHFTGDAIAARQALEEAIPGVDVIVQTSAHRRRKLIIADMDSTMITVECIDELADYAGIKDQIAAITARASAVSSNTTSAARGTRRPKPTM